MALKGLERETRRLGFKPAPWVQLRNTKPEVLEREYIAEQAKANPRFSVRVYARDDAQREERVGILKLLREKVANGEYTASKAESMANMLLQQWREESEAREQSQSEAEKLVAELAAARKLNAVLKGEVKAAENRIDRVEREADRLEKQAAYQAKLARQRKQLKDREAERAERERQRQEAWKRYEGGTMQRAMAKAGLKGKSR